LTSSLLFFSSVYYADWIKESAVLKYGMISLIIKREGSAMAASGLSTASPRHIQSPYSMASIVVD